MENACSLVTHEECRCIRVEGKVFQQMRAKPDAGIMNQRIYARRVAPLSAA